MIRSATYRAWQLRQPCALSAPGRCEETSAVTALFLNDPEDDLSSVRLCALHLDLTEVRSKPRHVDSVDRWHIVPGTLRLEALMAWMRFTRTATLNERRLAWQEIEECLA